MRTAKTLLQRNGKAMQSVLVAREVAHDQFNTSSKALHLVWCSLIDRRNKTEVNAPHAPTVHTLQ
jgi:hypothetical protein